MPPPMRRRPLLRAAAIGGGAYYLGKRREVAKQRDARAGYTRSSPGSTDAAPAAADQGAVGRTPRT